VMERQVSDGMPLHGETLGKVAVPALGAPNRVRNEQVVDEADAHAY
jgi:hypothetical protein